MGVANILTQDCLVCSPKSHQRFYLLRDRLSSLIQCLITLEVVVHTHTCMCILRLEVHIACFTGVS